MGVPSLIDLFDEKNHAQLPGGILESFGRLFKNDLKLYVYPVQPSPEDELKTVDDIKVRPELQPLYDYLAGRAVSSTSTTTGQTSCRSSAATCSAG